MKKKTPKTDTPEILCFSSMGNEPGHGADFREFAPAARVKRRREIDEAKNGEQRRQLLKNAPGRKPGSAPITRAKNITAAVQVDEMRKAAAKGPTA